MVIPQINGLVYGKILTGNHHFSHERLGVFLFSLEPIHQGGGPLVMFVGLF